MSELHENGSMEFMIEGYMIAMYDFYYLLFITIYILSSFSMVVKWNLVNGKKLTALRILSNF